MKKIVLTVCGWLLLGVAAVGIFLPLLPTTPLVLAAAVCFSVGNPRMYQRLLTNRVFGPYIEGWRSGRGISAGRKAAAIAVLWALLILSVVLTRLLWLGILLAAVGVGVTVHLLLMKTRRNTDDAQD